jgi:hypothetical protein
MKRLFAILAIGILALGIAGLSATPAGAGPANCPPNAAAMLDDVEVLADPAAHAERPFDRNRAAPAGQPRLACNSACARACAQRFGRCPTRECRQQFNACVRGCGC